MPPPRKLPPEPTSSAYPPPETSENANRLLDAPVSMASSSYPPATDQVEPVDSTGSETTVVPVTAEVPDTAFPDANDPGDDAPTAFDLFDDPEPLDAPSSPEASATAIDASIATLKPTSSARLLSPMSSAASLSSAAAALRHLGVEAANTADTATYVDPTPSTPLTASHPPSRSPSAAGGHGGSASETSPSPPRQSMELSTSQPRSDGAGVATDDDKRYLSDDDQDGGSRSAEIKTIMDQFIAVGGGPDAEEVMSPRLELAAPMLSAIGPRGHHQHPPRKSSLEPLSSSLAQQIHGLQALQVDPYAPASSVSKPALTSLPPDNPRAEPGGPDHGDQGPPVPPKDNFAAAITSTSSSLSLKSSFPPPPLPHRESSDNLHGSSPLSPTVSLHRPPPPEPEPEPVLPFDFHRFLEQLRHKKADPVARYLKSFLSEFGKRQWMVHEQVKIISDFLAFISNKMAVCEVWRDLTDAEFDNAREGMEKLVMNRLYSQTFSPAIPPPQPIPAPRSGRRRGAERVMGPGRRGQHQEDVERDEVLSQKIMIYGWIREQHLDIPPVADSGKRFLKLAQQELLKIRSYRAPRDKIICVLNCCKVIFGLLKHTKSDSSADSFMPLLIYVVLQANPDHLVSNVQYILRFRNQDKLGGESGYYLSSLMGVIQFIENMDRTTLTISDEEFEKNVEEAVSAIAEKPRAESPPLPPPPPAEQEKEKDKAATGTGRLSLRTPGEPSSAASASGSTRTGAAIDPRQSGSSSAATASAAGNDGDDVEEKDAITGLLRTIQRPLTTIGRMFSDETQPQAPAPTITTDGGAPSHANDLAALETPSPSSSRRALSAEEAAARQTSAETAEAQRLHRVEHATVVETLASMFPGLDRDIISDVVYQKEGRVGLAVDACLALSS